jgi:hypothetical protein
MPVLMIANVTANRRGDTAERDPALVPLTVREDWVSLFFITL